MNLVGIQRSQVPGSTGTLEPVSTGILSHGIEVYRDLSRFYWRFIKTFWKIFYIKVHEKKYIKVQIMIKSFMIKSSNKIFCRFMKSYWWYSHPTYSIWGWYSHPTDDGMVCGRTYEYGIVYSYCYRDFAGMKQYSLMSMVQYYYMVQYSIHPGASSSMLKKKNWCAGAY